MPRSLIVDQSGEVLSKPAAAGRTRPSIAAPAVLTLGLLAAHSIVVALRPVEPVSMAANLTFVGLALWWSIRRHLNGDDLGLSRAAAPRSALVGLALAVAIVAVVAVIAATGHLPPDNGVSTMASASMAFRLLVAVPIGTALCEELLFRGVLLAAWDRQLPAAWSTAIVSIAFGLWHVVAEWQRTHGPALIGGVLVTAAVSAFVLCPLRRRTGSIVAPMLVHAATNMSVLAALWFLR